MKELDMSSKVLSLVIILYYIYRYIVSNAEIEPWEKVIPIFVFVIIIVREVLNRKLLQKPKN